jgi:F-type H+-transporting ATPase subunit delta
MSNHRVAHRYSKSIIELSLEKDILEEVHADFVKLSTMVKGNRDLALMLNNPIISSEKKLKVLNALYATGAQKMTLTFFEIISRKGREDILVDVAKEFESQYNTYKSIQVAELTTTFTIDDKLRNQFIEIVKEISGLESVQLVEKINPELIGGYILKVNDRQLDESLSSKLSELKVEFSENHYESKI